MGRGRGTDLRVGRSAWGLWEAPIWSGKGLESVKREEGRSVESVAVQEDHQGHMETLEATGGSDRWEMWLGRDEASDAVDASARR